MLRTPGHAGPGNTPMSGAQTAKTQAATQMELARATGAIEL